MKKWNEVYFYTYDSDGTIVTKNKIINIFEGTGTEGGHNLSIYPVIDDLAVAVTCPDGPGTVIDPFGTVHKHYTDWIMFVDVCSFYTSDPERQSEVNHYKDSTGAHEMGHVLGLRDMDVCASANGNHHHAELLMGYHEETNNPQEFVFPSGDISYKDIAGVAITRGLHTDYDHKWLYVGIESNLTFKLVCSVCNGVKRVSSLSGYAYDTYGSCNENHNLSSGNMMAVACYGTKDYYKCKYCRYVAPFESNVEQNYLVDERVDATQHTVINNVTGLTYTTYASHSYNYSYESNTTHKGVCLCGDTISKAHWVKRTELINNRYGRCLDCGALIDLGGGFAETDPFNGTAKVSVNGSYILPNGIIVLEDADVEAYLNGTLVFYDPGDLPVTQ